MNRSRTSVLVWLVCVFGMTLACTLPGLPGPITTTEEAVPLWDLVTLGSTLYEETGQRPDYTLTTRTPVLSGSDDLRVVVFNQQMTILVQEEIGQFRTWLADMSVEPIAMGSFFALDFEQVSPHGRLLSLQFTIQFYADGAAHPGSYHRSVTYDLENGNFITLDQLFLPEADYLGVLSALCITDLGGRDIGFEMFSTGAEPVAENYTDWNLTADALMITFEEYQVAAYAAGPQVVLIPYADLSALIDPAGPLSALVP